MRGNELLDKMELVDPEYVEAADTAGAKDVSKKKKGRWVKWAAAAACAAAVLAGVLLLHPQNNSTVSLGGILREYKDVNIGSGESAIIWPWEYQTALEQYTVLEFDGKNFGSSGMAVSEALLGETVGDYEVVGYDIYTDKEYRMEAEVRRINGISGERMVAVKLGDEFCVFKYREYEPPATFGEVLDQYSLEQILDFERFTVYEGHTDKGVFRLEDDQYIWDVLSACRDAVFVEDDTWSRAERDYISFTVTSEALGVYKKVFYVTEDGYIWTNIFDYAYLFEIGEDAAEQIISYAKENGTETEAEPYVYTLTGTLTEITDEYILVDDSIMCSDPADGMVFKIYTDDVRIRRCIEFEGIGEGAVVVVSFTGSIDTAAGNVVEGAYSMSEGILYDGAVAVPE